MIYGILLWNISADKMKNGYTYCIFIFATVFGFEQPFYTFCIHLVKIHALSIAYHACVRVCVCARARVGVGGRASARALSYALMKHVIKLGNLSTNS